MSKITSLLHLCELLLGVKSASFLLYFPIHLFPCPALEEVLQVKFGGICSLLANLPGSYERKRIKRLAISFLKIPHLETLANCGSTNS